MKKIVLFCLGVAAAADVTSLVGLLDPKQPAVSAIMKKFDTDKMAKELESEISKEMEKKVHELLDAELKLRVEKQLNTKVKSWLAEEKDVDQKWTQLRIYQQATWDQYRKMMLQQKLAMIQKQFVESESNTVLQEFWPDLPKDSQNMDAFTVKFDRKNNIMQVVSVESDNSNKPLYEWEANVNSGKISKTTRKSDGTHEKVLEQMVDPMSLKPEMVSSNLQTTVEKINEVKTAEQLVKADENKAAPATTETPTSKTEDPVVMNEEWDDLEMQRDIAFKIMYFFIIFIVMTFGLLYLYFRLNKQAEEEEAARRGQKPITDNNDDRTFKNFLMGLDDERASHLVNPSEKSVDGRFDFMIGQSAGQASATSRSINIGTGRNDHRDNHGFGANNLEQLSNNLYQN